MYEWNNFILCVFFLRKVTKITSKVSQTNVIQKHTRFIGSERNIISDLWITRNDSAIIKIPREKMVSISSIADWIISTRLAFYMWYKINILLVAITLTLSGWFKVYVNFTRIYKLDKMQYLFGKAPRIFLVVKKIIIKK